MALARNRDPLDGSLEAMCVVGMLATGHPNNVGVGTDGSTTAGSLAREKGNDANGLLGVAVDTGKGQRYNPSLGRGLPGAAAAGQGRRLGL